MSKVTYLFGAGASANALPVVKTIPEELEVFRDKFRAVSSWGPSKHKNIVDLRNDFNTALDDLIVNVRAHASIDTYAKKLSITGPIWKEKQLKTILSGFLIYKQTTTPVDNRYDSFFAALVGSNRTQLPANVRILSWNYDLQFEKAYSAYSENTVVSDNQAFLNVNFRGSDRYSSSLDKFGIYKLNGSAGFYEKSFRNYYPIISNLNALTDEEFFTELIEFYGYYLHPEAKLRSTLNFAWESDCDDEYFNYVRKAIEGTTVLVIVGYSIPFFNRAIDRGIIGGALMKSLDHIYIQDLYPADVEESLTSIGEWKTGVTPKLRSNVTQFYLPPQL